jgi:hypothetical protein
MAKTLIPIDQLAKMINEGFKTTATKEDMAALHSEMNEKFAAVESRLSKIEDLLLEGQRRRLDNLGTRMKNSKTPSPSSQRASSWRRHAPSRHALAVFVLHSSVYQRLEPNVYFPAPVHLLH